MKKLLLLGVFSTLASFVFAQTKISGAVKDATTGELLPGVNVVSTINQKVVTTSITGSFTIEVPALPAELQFSFIGYETITATAKTNQLLITLAQSQTQLNEVVITALGLKRDSKDLGYVVQKLDEKELSEVKAVNFVDNLSGKLAGVTVTQGPTGVGSSSKITIRGEASFTNNNPLFVVDGIPINNNSIINPTSDAAAGFQEIDFGNGAMEVNPDDVESVTVLKGPAAAALYGTRASNGVILINTKDGSNAKGKLGVSFNTTTYLETPFKLPEFQNKYAQGNGGQFAFEDGLGGGVNDLISYSYGPELDKGNFTPQYDSPSTLPDGTVVRGGDVAVRNGSPITATELKSNPNNLKDFYQTGVTTINNLAVSSGFEKGSYRISYTDLRSESIIPGVNLDRKTAAARLNFQPSSKLKVTTAITYVNSQSDNRPANGYGSENIGYGLVAWGPRSLNITNMKDYWQPGLEDIQQYSFNYTYFDNPYFTLLENRNAFNRDRIFGVISANYSIDEHWSVRLRSGMDFSNEQRTFRRAFSSNRFKNGAYAEQQVFFRENNSDLLVNYNQKFGNFSLDVSAGANRMDQFANNMQTIALSLAKPGIYSLNNSASPLQINTASGQKRINSVYALAKLGYKNFLYVDITGRNDWSSALATPINSANVSFFYPSFSSGFILSNVVDLPQQISFAKLRASWAQVGNDTDPYQTTGTYATATTYGGQPSFTGQDFIANGNLLPEKTSATEIGADVRFLRDRIRLDVTYYNALTENQIISLPVPSSSGYSQQVVNGAQVRNKGLEVILAATPVKKENFTWNTQFNFSRNRATVEDLPDGVEKLTLAYSRVYDNQNQTVWVQVEEGGRIGDLYGTGYLKNDDGRFVVDANGKLIANNNLIKLGNANPDFILGWTNNLTYKNWNLGLVFDWRQGGVLVSRTRALAGVAGQLKETENRPDGGIVVDGVQNVGTAENPVYVENTTARTAEQYYREYYDRNHEENNTYDASYFKLRQAALTYTFSPTTKTTGFLQQGRNLSISLIGRNLFAFSQIPHFDPEQLAVQGQKFVSGVEDISYASSRSIGLKLRFNF